MFYNSLYNSILSQISIVVCLFLFCFVLFGFFFGGGGGGEFHSSFYIDARNNKKIWERNKITNIRLYHKTENHCLYHQTWLFISLISKCLLLFYDRDMIRTVKQIRIRRHPPPQPLPRNAHVQRVSI